MSTNRPSIEKLEKQLRVLQRKLKRSQWHRTDLENQHDRDQHLYRRLHADLEAARREAEVEAALERVRAQAMAMRSSDELLDVIFKIHQEYSGLGLPCGAFWHTRYTPECYHKALTGIDGQKLAAIMELPRDFASNPALAAWERGDEKIGVFKFDTEGACHYLHHMVTKGKFHEIDPEAITEEMVRENDGWTFVQARTSHGEIGYSLWGETEPSQEAKDVLVRFAKTFDLAYQRFEDLQQAEARAREAQIEASLERVRSRAMAMHSSDDISDATAIVFAELERLGIATLRCGVIIMHESKHMDTWTATATAEDQDLRIVGRIDMTIHPLLEGVFEAWKAQQPFYVYEMIGEDMQAYYQAIARETSYPLPEQRTLSPRQFCYGFIFPEGALFAFTEKPLAEESIQIFKRFASVFALTYRRYLDLKKAEEQAREAQIEAALERVRSRTMAMHQPDELQEVVTLVAERLLDLGVVFDAGGVIICTYFEDSKDVVHWLASPDFSSSKPYLLPYFDHRIFNEAWASRERGDDFFSKAYAVEEKNSFFQHAFEHSDYRYFPEEFKEWTLAAEHHALTFAWSLNAAILIPSFTDIVPSESEKEILKRFANVFEQAYIRFLDLKKAEAQAREAEIELALERVRVRTMAMQKSEELSETSALLFSQIKELGIETWTSGFNIWEEDERACIGYNATPAGCLGVPIRLPLTEDPFFQTIYEAKKRGDEFLVFESEGESLAETYRYMFTLPVVKDVMQGIVDEGFDLPEYQVTHCGFFSHGHLMFITLEPCPEAWDVFKRFTKVFEQTYTRFLDLQKAEAQAREAEIEASLERVRARAMAMHSSDDISDATAIVFTELERLGISTLRFGINIIHDSGHMDLWTATATAENKDLRVLGRLDKTMHPMLEGLFEAWKAQQPIFTYELAGEDLQSYYQALREAPEYDLPQDARPVARHFAYLFMFPEGGLYNFAQQPLAEEAIQIFKRFTAVFAQTYRRYQDLKQAEAQAYEAQIEAALERVRAKTMAMHTSEELLVTAQIVYHQLEGLGLISPLSDFEIGILDEETGEVTVWQTDLSLTGAPSSLTLFFTDVAPVADEFQRWRQTHPEARKDLLIVNEYTGEVLAETLQFLMTQPGWVEAVQLFQEAEITHWVTHHAYFSHGLLALQGPATLDEQSQRVLKRFASVFEQTYTRYLDLQQAEARAREAEQQASVDRVRAVIASMRTTDDLQHITPLIWRELTALGVPFFRCGVFIMDEATEQMQAFLSDPHGKPLAALQLPYDMAPTTQAAAVHWHQRQIYTDVWDQEQFVAWTQAITQSGLIETSDAYQGASAPPETLALHFVPFEQGMLYVGSTAPLADEAVELVQALADAFAVAYARYEDFQRLEAKNREVEAAMDELKATQQQLVQSEKMASLGALTAGIAHEIKNPLNFINNFAALSRELADELEEETDPEEMQAILADIKLNASKIEEHGKRADSIVRSMMQHTRAGNGERERVALNKFVDEYVDLSWHGKRAQTPDFNAHIVRDYEEAVGRLDVVPQDLGRVLINLLSNAFDALCEQSVRGNGQYAPTVVVSTRQVDGNVEIRVEDNGPGISADLKAKIFEPFFTTKPTGSGTGLGLSLSYDIVTQGHGGTLSVESEEGQGAAFIITIPAYWG